MADYKISRPTTCKSCRERKIRCNGANPCGSCLRSRASLVCEYPPGRSNLPRSELPKGAACIPCRQRKRKCDGRRPCLPCRNKSRADACKYQQNKRGQHREPDSLLDEHFTTFEEIALMDASCSALVISDPERAVDMSVETTQDNISVHSIAEPSVNVALPPILHPTGISNLSVSCTSNPTDGDTAAELSSLRSLFLDNCWEYGLNLSPEKQKAIAHGDTSGAVVHPIFISISQLIGYLLASRPNSGRWAHSQGQTGAEAQGLRVLQMLESLTEAPDPLTCVQVYKVLALYCAYKKDSRGMQEFLGSASNVVLRHAVLLGLEDSVAAEGDTPARGLMEAGRSELAHIVYIEMAAGMLMKAPPKLPPVLLAKFRRLAVNNYKVTEVYFARAKSLSLLLQSQQLVAEWNRCETGTIWVEWSERYRNLANTTQGYLHILRAALVDVPHLPKVQVLALRGCAVMLLAALAELYALFAPFHAEARQKHRNIIDAVASITRLLVPSDHEYFDCTFEVCLDIASREITEQLPSPQWRLSLATLVFPSSPRPLQIAG